MSKQKHGQPCFLCVKSSRSHAQVIARFTCRKIHTVILATNDLSIYLPFCAKHHFDNSSARLKSPHMQKSKSSASQKKKKKNQTDATINRLQTVCSKKLSARTISKQCGLASAHGARGRKRAQRVNNSGFCSGSESVVLPHRMCVPVCVEVQKSITDYPSLSLPFFFLSPSHLLQSPPLTN